MVTLKEGKILESWSGLIADCRDEDESFFQSVERQLEQFEAPCVIWRRETVAPGWVKGLMGKRRDFVIVEHEQFVDFTFYISARPYGTLLSLCWYLAAAPRSPLVKLAAHAVDNLPGSALFGLDLFDLEDLRSYVTVGHRAVRKAVEDLIEKRKLHVEVDWKSRGILAVS